MKRQVDRWSVQPIRLHLHLHPRFRPQGRRFHRVPHLPLPTGHSSRSCCTLYLVPVFGYSSAIGLLPIRESVNPENTLVQWYAQVCKSSQLILGVWGISLLHLKEVLIRSAVVLSLQATMKETSQDIESKPNLQPSVQVGDEESEQPNTIVTDEPLGDSCSLSCAGDDNKKVSREDIELVQNLIERCLQLYMNRGEVVRTLSTRARIEPGFTTLVWKKLEEENSEFFQAYYIRLKLKKQINLFNHLLEHQYNLMKHPVPQQVPFAPTQNGIRPMPVNNMPMGYPVLQQPGIPAPGQPHVNAMACGTPGHHIANGIPYHPIRMSSGNGIMDNEAPEVAHAATAFGTVSSEIAMSPSSAMSSNHVSFTPSEISAMDVDPSAIDASFGVDVGNGGPLQIGLDSGDGSSLGQQIWDFSLSDLSADLTNLGDLAALENYDGNPFLPSDSDLLLDSPDQDDIVDYFADAVDGPSQSDEER